MRLVIPGTMPSVNHMYHNRMMGYRDKTGKPKKRRIRVLTDEAEAYSNLIVAMANTWRNSQQWETAKGKVIVNLWYYFPDRKKRDTHNTLKLLLDCLEAAQIYENDQYALPRIIDFEVDKKNPRVEIEFERVSA